MTSRHSRTSSATSGRGPSEAARARPARPQPAAGPVAAGRTAASAAEPVGQGVEVGRRGHLRVVRSAAPAPQPEA